jgi:hypothetical protein
MSMALALLMILDASAARDGGCDFVVRFTSHCCGIATKQVTQLENYLQANDGMVKNEKRLAGREGEREYCVRLVSHMDLPAVNGHLAGILRVPTGKKDVPSGTVMNCRMPKPDPLCQWRNP